MVNGANNSIISILMIRINVDIARFVNGGRLQYWSQTVVQRPLSRKVVTNNIDGGIYVDERLSVIKFRKHRQTQNMVTNIEAVTIIKKNNII